MEREYEAGHKQQNRRRALYRKHAAAAGYFVYVLVHPTTSKVKVGICRHPVRRLGNYNTCCPERAYTFTYLAEVSGKFRDIERKAHNILHLYKHSGEWYRCTVLQAIDAIEKAVAYSAQTVLQVTDSNKPDCAP